MENLNATETAVGIQDPTPMKPTHVAYSLDVMESIKRAIGRLGPYDVIAPIIDAINTKGEGVAISNK